MKLIKKILISFLILELATLNLFACGGCTDATLGTIKTTQAIAKYEKDEVKIASQIIKINEYFNIAIAQVEEQNLQENENLKKLTANKALKEKETIFTLNIQNELQSLINSIEAQ